MRSNGLALSTTFGGPQTIPPRRLVCCAAMTVSYPEPPWHTHGFGVSVPFMVPTSELCLPRGLTPRKVVAGHCPGMLSYVEYTAPSPLEYHELIWMPAYVGAEGARATGWYVARMYVDDETTLVAGREVWALPKSMASFRRHARGVDIVAADGTELSLSFRRLGLAVPAKGSMATVQVRGGGFVRFRADFRARVAPAMLRVGRMESRDEAWRSYRGAKRLPLLASMMTKFESTMQPPLEVLPLEDRAS